MCFVSPAHYTKYVYMHLCIIMQLQGKLQLLKTVLFQTMFCYTETAIFILGSGHFTER